MSIIDTSYLLIVFPIFFSFWERHQQTHLWYFLCRIHLLSEMDYCAKGIVFLVKMFPLDEIFYPFNHKQYSGFLQRKEQLLKAFTATQDVMNVNISQDTERMKCVTNAKFFSEMTTEEVEKVSQEYYNCAITWPVCVASCGSGFYCMMVKTKRSACRNV